MALKKFRVTDEADNYVELLVNTDKLTTDLATEINNFWGDSAYRLEQADGDVVAAVVRLFGSSAIRCFYEDGGVNDIDKGWNFTQQVLDWTVEGWPALDELGIQIVDALVLVPEFDNVTLEVIAT